ncbi:MAG: glucosaminidase domain-containing protein [Bacteroidota bacterium]
MDHTFSTNVLTYLKANWMKVAMLALLCFVFLKKDLSFEFNLNSPLKVEEPIQDETVIPESKEEGKRSTVITEKIEKIEKKGKDQVVKGSTAGILERLSWPFFGKAKDRTVRPSEHGEIDELTIEGYIKRFAHVAISERKKFGIPASIILANALFHSFAGQGEMVLNGNNHFAIPCGQGWNGGRGKYQGACYRHYENAWLSFRDHSLYITEGKAFKHLNQYGRKDYRSWARGLSRAGYSDRRDLEENLLSLIDKYNLSDFD